LLVHIINIDNAGLTDTEITLPFRARKCSSFSFEDNVSAELTAPDRVAVKKLKTICTLKLTLEEVY
ncbi:MAG: hypothetical protein J6S73_02850, partial [Lentisphaeria bacterium]|nr:hypothetical protein [Lentisphaeria bacterium]